MITWKKDVDFSDVSEINILLARSNVKSHSYFLWVVMFNLTNFWVCENSVSFFRTQKSC